MSLEQITEFAEQISNITSVPELKKLFSNNLPDINEVLQKMSKDEPKNIKLMQLFVLIYSKFPKWSSEETQENPNIKIFPTLFLEKIIQIYGGLTVKAELNKLKQKVSDDLKISLSGIFRDTISILCLEEFYHIYDLYYEFDKNTKDPKLSQVYLINIKQRVSKIEKSIDSFNKFENLSDVKDKKGDGDNKFSRIREECALILHAINTELHPYIRNELIDSKYAKIINALPPVYEDHNIDITPKKCREDSIKDIRETFFTLLRSVGYVMNLNVSLSDNNKKLFVTSLTQTFATIKNINKNILLNNQEATTIANLKNIAKNQEVGQELINIIDEIEAFLPKKQPKKKSRALQKSNSIAVQEVRYIDKEASDIIENDYKNTMLELSNSFAKLEARIPDDLKRSIFKDFLMIKFKLAFVNSDKEGAMPYFKEIEDHPLFRDYVKKALLGNKNNIEESNEKSEACLAEIARMEAN